MKNYTMLILGSFVLLYVLWIYSGWTIESVIDFFNPQNSQYDEMDELSALKNFTEYSSNHQNNILRNVLHAAEITRTENSALVKIKKIQRTFYNAAKLAVKEFCPEDHKKFIKTIQENHFELVKETLPILLKINSAVTVISKHCLNPNKKSLSEKEVIEVFNTVFCENEHIAFVVKKMKIEFEYDKKFHRLLIDYAHKSNIDQTLLNELKASINEQETFMLKNRNAIAQEQSKDLKTFLSRMLYIIFIESIINKDQSIVQNLQATNQEYQEKSRSLLNKLKVYRWKIDYIKQRPETQIELEAYARKIQDRIADINA